MMSHDVTLPRVREPKFPDSCVVCGLDHPGSTTRFSESESHWWHIFVWWWWGSRHKVYVPACMACGMRLQLWRWLRWLLSIAVVVGAFFLYDRLIGFPSSRGSRRLVMVLVGLVGLVPVIILYVAYPLAFDLTVGKDTVDYEFRDPDYAQAFAIANESSVN